MEKCGETEINRISHKKWRGIAKRERRRRLRRAAARRRDDDEEQQSAALEHDANYLKLLEDKKLEMKIEAWERQEREKQWLEEEVNTYFKSMLSIFLFVYILL